MAKRCPAISRIPCDGYGDERVTYRLYPETAALFGECLKFFVKHHPGHPQADALKDWANVMLPRKKNRRRG